MLHIETYKWRDSASMFDGRTPKTPESFLGDRLVRFAQCFVTVVFFMLGTFAVPAAAQTTLNGISKISAGYFHTCAVTNGGGVKCWGLNSNGQLGDFGTTQHLSAVTVNSLTNNVSSVAGGFRHTCGLTSTGGVKCWGNNVSGELGDNTNISRATAADVSGLTSGVTAISAGVFHTCALTSGGGVKCWGDNSVGSLGDGTTTASSAPVDVSGLTSGVTAISAGSSYTCALTSGGGIKCWGYNDSGQLGDNSTTMRLTPVDVTGMTSGVTAISARESHTCALTGSGGIKCWGLNANGQLGDNSTNPHLTAVDVSGLTSGMSAISVGEAHSCAMTNSGGVKCWGKNTSGQLGDNTTVQHLTAVDVLTMANGITAISAGSRHTCALTGNGEVKCWGEAARGLLGSNSTNERLTAVDVNGLTNSSAAITAGDMHVGSPGTELEFAL